MLRKLRKGKASAPKQDGAAAVEFALICPVLFLFLLGIVELGRALSVQHTLEEIARAGCRMATEEDVDTQDVADFVESSLSAAGIDNARATVAWDTTSYSTAAVTVTVTTSYSDVNWVPMPRFLTNRSLTAPCTLPLGENAAKDAKDNKDSNWTISGGKASKDKDKD